MQRRSFLSAFASVVGAGAAAPAALTVERAAAVLGVPPDAPVSDIMQASVGVEPCNPIDMETWRLFDMLDGYRRNLNAPERYMPARIASKRSWSATYKASVHAREQLLYDLARAKLMKEQGTFAEIMRRLLGDDHA